MATIEAALMAQHGLSVVELRARWWDTLRAAFAPPASVVPMSRRVGRLLRGEAISGRGLGARGRPKETAASCARVLDRAVQTPARVNVTWVTPLGEEVASTS